ncbi:MAG TPA: ATP-grasp domain-containing protein [Acidobacteriota bacterium]|nr:ATP-grasp domain-containing protein [Acidobacteriota bacterium]
MIILSEATLQNPTTPSEQNNRDLTDAAQMAGCKVYFIPSDFSVCETAENALWHIPEQPTETAGVWIGFIPSAERYAAIYTEALKKGIRLINSIDEHLTAQEFDRAYPLLSGLTPESRTLTNLEETAPVGEALGFPLFVRGSARSSKSDGWNACVATSPDEFHQIVERYFASQYRSRGRVIARKLVQFKAVRSSDKGFPFGREFRTFICHGEIVACGYYWDGHDPLMHLSPAEATQVANLALEAAARLKVPFVAVDVGQLVNDEWIVIEVNDAQFAGTTSQINRLAFWNSVAERLVFTRQGGGK